MDPPVHRMSWFWPTKGYKAHVYKAWICWIYMYAQISRAERFTVCLKNMRWKLESCQCSDATVNHCLWNCIALYCPHQLIPLLPSSKLWPLLDDKYDTMCKITASDDKWAHSCNCSPWQQEIGAPFRWVNIWKQKLSMCTFCIESTKFSLWSARLKWLSGIHILFFWRWPCLIFCCN